jgi:hypothetical protein
MRNSIMRSDRTSRSLLGPVRAFIAMVIAAILAPVSSNAGLPEPGVVLYGKVYQDGFLATSGTLVFTYSSASAQTVTVTTDLGRFKRLDGDEYSYALELPADLSVAGQSQEPNTLLFSPNAILYSRSATLNGAPLPFVPGTATDVQISGASRGSSERVDFLLSGDIPSLPGQPTDPIPVAFSVDVPVQTIVDWSDVPAPVIYDVFLWLGGTPRPDLPAATDVVPSFFDPAGDLSHLTEYAWQVRARNGAGVVFSDTWTFTTVPPAPTFSSHPVSITVNAGREARFQAQATGAGSIALQWQKDNIDIGGATSNLLALPSTTAADNGAYRLGASNTGGTTFSNPASLTVIDPSQGNDASIVLQEISPVMLRGRSYQVRISFRNESQVTWSTLQGFSLAVLMDEAGILGGATKVDLPNPLAAIAPQATVLFHFSPIIPKTHPEGIFRLQLQMQEEGFEAFGDVVDVFIEIPNASADWELYE